MKEYLIVYETEYGEADFCGEYASYESFIDAASKEARANGLIESGKTVLDCVVVLQLNTKEKLHPLNILYVKKIRRG